MVSSDLDYQPVIRPEIQAEYTKGSQAEDEWKVKEKRARSLTAGNREYYIPHS